MIWAFLLTQYLMLSITGLIAISQLHIYGHKLCKTRPGTFSSALRLNLQWCECTMAVCWGLQNSHHFTVLLCLSQIPRKEEPQYLLSTLFVALLFLLLHWQLEQKHGLPSVFIPFIAVSMPVLTLTSSFTSTDQTCLLISEVKKLNFDHTIEKKSFSSFYAVSLLSTTTAI